jgi:hypothetical protein
MYGLKYCCVKFESYHKLHNQTRPNIRIVKYTSDFLINSVEVGNKLRSPYRFYITFGYEKFEIDMLSIFIEYCPFCGVDLFKFYTKEEFANEIEEKTFFLRK